MSRLKRANDHTAGCPRYLGRTSSYMEFGEAVAADIWIYLGEISEEAVIICPVITVIICSILI